MFLVLGMLACRVATAQIDVLDRVEITPGDGQSEIHIYFNIPVRYKSHAPREAGDLLRISLDPVPTMGAEADVLFGEESVQWSATDEVPLYEVRYQSTGFATTSVSLQFEREVRFEVPPSPDFNSLVIIVKHPAGAKPAEQVTPASELRYAINLASSTEQFVQDEIPVTEDMLAYRLYTTSFIKGDVTWYRLRLGFFAQKAEADLVLARMQKFYPGSWVAPVGAGEISFSESAELAARKPTPVAAPAPAPSPPQQKPAAAPVIPAVAAEQEERAYEAAPQKYRYAINLSSSTQPFTPDVMPVAGVLQSYRIYTTSMVKDGTTWYRLRLGFFTSKAEADEARKRLQGSYPGCWLAKVDSDEVLGSADSRMTARLPAVAVPVAKPGKVPAAPEAVAKPEVKVTQPPAGSVTQADVDKLAGLMEQANTMLADKDYDGAIRLYTKILQYPENPYSASALEFTGLARERKGQMAHAKMAYETYLEQYQEGEGAERVRQRLAGLLTATSAPKEKLTRVAGEREPQRIWDVFGGFSQFYRRDENTSQINDENELSVVTQSSLSSDLDITGRTVKGDNDLRTRLTGGYLYSFLNEGGENETTVSALYFDARNRPRRMGMRIGRQSRSKGGVLGRFDGLLVELPITSSVASLALTGGFPVQSARDSFDNSRYFYGASLQLEDFLTGWDANLFYIEQVVDSITDRQAVGGELRYFDPGKSIFTLVDYDIFYNQLNTVQLLGNWSITDRTVLNILADYRNSPILTTSNALSGQGLIAETIEDLLQSMSEEDIYSLAQDRTADNRLLTLGVAHTLSDHWQFSGDVTYSNLSDMPGASYPGATPVEPIPGTDNEYFYTMQMIGSNLLLEGDLNIFGLRFINATVTDTTSLSVNARYPIGKDFRINPRLRIDFRRNLMDNTEQYIYRPSARLTWNVRRRFRIDAELGGEWSDREIVTGSQTSSGYYLNLGYRADF